ncbi:hypothetical protein [Corynebacterium propinquum]|uniref:hypothetical protein n=1 Tax=Corynebacterium propinquum TaxID=43769 RepID=UPI00128E09F4|nr:hypothetical protein [Corynebacterium propinquum]QQU85867.1 hypothetical protein I6I70_09185 [Corynebacterium propinquum]QQU90207.1 hypothetical protein I6I69_07935 [Corynebacterium propinquum]
MDANRLRRHAKIFAQTAGEEKRNLRKLSGFSPSKGRSIPVLGTHAMSGVKATDGSTIYISYVENHTPTAWRLYWSYWGKNQIAVIYAGPHPE